MTYTATDTDGGDASFEFTITVQAAPQVALQVAKPAAPTVTRTEFSEPSKPALDVTWTAPDGQRSDDHQLRSAVPQAGHRG